MQVTILTVVFLCLVSLVYSFEDKYTLENISWSVYLKMYPEISLDSFSFRNFKENVAFGINNNKKNPDTIFGISPLLHLSKSQFNQRFEDNTLEIPFYYNQISIIESFEEIKTDRYYNWLDKNILPNSVDSGNTASSWIYTSKSAIESYFMINFDQQYNLDITNIKACSYDYVLSRKLRGNRLVNSPYIYLSSSNLFLIDTYERINDKCIDTEDNIDTIWMSEEVRNVNFYDAIYSGPIVVELDLKFDQLQYYSNEILSLKSDNIYPNYSGLIVGFGKEEFSSYFIIQTSFGSSWGDRGTFKLDINSNAIKYLYQI